MPDNNETTTPAHETPSRAPEDLRLGRLTIHGDRAALFAALARAQRQFQPLERTREVKVETRDGRDYSFSYAPLDEVLDSTRPHLNAEGLALLSVMGDGPKGDGDAELHTLLTHESGAFLHIAEVLPPVGKAQERGSQVTYRRRYQTQCVTGVAAEFDDDGNAADGNKASFAPKGGPRRTPPAVPPRQEPPKAAPRAPEPREPVADGPVTDEDRDALKHAFARANMSGKEVSAFCVAVCGRGPKEMLAADVLPVIDAVTNPGRRAEVLAKIGGGA